MIAGTSRVRSISACLARADHSRRARHVTAKSRKIRRGLFSLAAHVRRLKQDLVYSRLPRIRIITIRLFGKS